MPEQTGSPNARRPARRDRHAERPIWALALTLAIGAAALVWAGQAIGRPDAATGLPAASDARDGGVRDAGTESGDGSTSDAQGDLSDAGGEAAPSAPGPSAPPVLEPGPTTLPPVEPDPIVAPFIEEAVPQAPPEARSIPTSDRPQAVIRVIIGLVALMALAYLGGQRRVLDWERRLGISQVITAGLPFILLGMLARLPAVGILTDPVLTELSPLLRIGLGSIGFIAGFRFDAKLFQGLPKGTSSVAMLSTLVPSATVAAATAPLLLLLSGQEWSSSLRDPVFVRDALILATAGAMTAPSALRLLEHEGKIGVAARIIRIEELAGVLGLAFVAAFFRQHGLGGGWHLPGMAWLLLTLGLGTALGLLFYTILVATPTEGPDFLAVTIGAIAFAAGAAGYLQLSSVAVSFVAGVILANFPGTFQPRMREMLKRIERPIYLLALFIIGALWNVDDWRGWALMPVFMLARLAGKRLAAAIAARHRHLPLTTAESRALAISPIGALAIAIVVNAQLLYPGGEISLVVSAVIGGGVLTEAFVQMAARRSGRAGRGPGQGGKEGQPDRVGGPEPDGGTA